MNVTLLAHTQLSEEYIKIVDEVEEFHETKRITDGQAVALTAIRTCYSPNKPSEIIVKEGAKYFGNRATDGKEGTEANRLFRMIVRSNHTSTLEHLSFTFAIEGVSRALLAQLTRHRIGFSYSVQSQRYVKFGSGDRSSGFDYVKPESITEDKYVQGNTEDEKITALELFNDAMMVAQETYDMLREVGISAEDARAVLPNAAATNIVMTANLRALLDFYHKRHLGGGAQFEISQLAEELRKAIVEVEPWTNEFFEMGAEK